MHTRILLQIALFVTVAWGIVSARAHGDEPPASTLLQNVLAKYPSRPELQSRVDQFKADHTSEYAAALTDFDLAIRSMLTLEFPRTSEEISRHGRRKEKILPMFKTRQRWMELIDRYTTNSETGLAQFCEVHLDEIAIEDCPAFDWVCCGILLQDWTEWEAWQSPKLAAIRSESPHIHKYYAMRHLAQPSRRTQAKLCFGVGVDFMLDDDMSSVIRKAAGRLVVRMAQSIKDPDLVSLALTKASEAGTDTTAKSDLLSAAGATIEELAPEMRISLCVPFLESDSETIRSFATIAIGKSIRKPRAGEPPRELDSQLASRLASIAEDDPSSRVRELAHRQKLLYDTSDTRPTHGRLGPEGGSFP